MLGASIRGCYGAGMREATIYVASGVALLGGICFACVARQKSISSETQFATRAPAGSTAMRDDSLAAPKARGTKSPPPSAPAETADANSTPEAVFAWRRKDKDEIKQRVARLSASDAENLCFTLRLIPRDEVFDKINVKGRLDHYVEGLRTEAEITDVQNAFRDLEAHH
jgi:hypothetical protein